MSINFSSLIISNVEFEKAEFQYSLYFTFDYIFSQSKDIRGPY